MESARSRKEKRCRGDTGLGSLKREGGSPQISEDMKILSWRVTTKSKKVIWVVYQEMGFPNELRVKISKDRT